MCKQNRSVRLRVALVTLMCATAVTVPMGAPAPVVWNLVAPPDLRPLRPGDRVEVTVGATIERGWYVYAMTQPPGGPTPLRITVPDRQPFALADAVTGPAPKRAWDPNFEIESAKHEGTVAFTVPLQVAPSAARGKTTLRVEVRYQACSDTLCLRPKTETLSLPLDIAGRDTAGAPLAREHRQ
jgi:DsbC/DsbD-like thiol-disulfide interchange protein